MALDSMQGITIPTKSKNEISLLEEINTTLNMWDLSPEEKAWYEEEKRNEKIKRQLAIEEERIAKLQLKYNTPLIHKMKYKLTKTYDKYLANGYWFKASLKAFQNLGKKAGNWLMDILKFIFLLAIFDPKGKFLNSIVDFILKMVEWFVDILIKYVPKIIKVMIFLITKVIPEVLKKIVVALSEMIYKMFGAMIEKMPDGPLKSILQFIQKGFGKDGIITKFFSKLAGFFPVFLIILGALKLFSVLAPIFSLIGTAIGFLIPLFTSLGSVLFGTVIPVIGSLLIALWPFIAIGAALFLLWKYAEKISDFFDGLISRFKAMSGWMKTLVGILAIIAFPITTFIGALYGLVKIFKMFKKYGVGESFKMMGKGIAKFAKGAKDWAISKVSNAWDSAKNAAGSAWQSTKSAVGAGVDWLSGLATKLKEAIKSVWNDYIYKPFSIWFDTLTSYIYKFLLHPLGGGDVNAASYAVLSKMIGGGGGKSTSELEKSYLTLGQENANKLLYELNKSFNTNAKNMEELLNIVIKLKAENPEKIQRIVVDKAPLFQASYRNVK